MNLNRLQFYIKFSVRAPFEFSLPPGHYDFYHIIIPLYYNYPIVNGCQKIGLTLET